MPTDGYAQGDGTDERGRSWWIVGPGLAAIALSVVAFSAEQRMLEQGWGFVVSAVVLLVLLIWVSVALRRVSGPRPAARVIGIVGIVAAGAYVLQVAALYGALLFWAASV
ncbi:MULTISPECIES: hypothetical protein [unclassified Curtobacterium]|uniref:hypothetical protein n=1 Tax=unclassified Curtobacterium TaxID=257496 RepID=UPI000F4B005E|nr:MULTISPECIES: hypothetical protein [unclassified Curtobacterium]ROP64806.1 hypothetical protein EDF55_1457 [Curtobacterium sp. ZW137]TCK63726.1 hypothetical protein EDF27_2272 [Curtobacterium sp. PhB136]